MYILYSFSRRVCCVLNFGMYNQAKQQNMTGEKQTIKTIEEAIALVNKKWVFDSVKYPKLRSLTEKGRLEFKLKHTFSLMCECKDLYYLEDDFKTKLSMILFSLEGEEQFFKLFIICAKFVELLDIEISEIQPLAKQSDNVQEEYNTCIHDMTLVFEWLDDNDEFLPKNEKENLKKSILKFMPHLLSFEYVETPWEYLNKNLREFLKQ